jgi:hypothetical protein
MSTALAHDDHARITTPTTGVIYMVLLPMIISETTTATAGAGFVPLQARSPAPAFPV